MNDAYWSEPSVWPILTGNDVDVWLSHLPAARTHIARFDSVLSADEQERSRRFRFAEHRDRWQIARGLLRLLLARYCGAAPADFRFTYNAHGKPEVPGGGVHFNSSHSGEFVALAFTRAGAVGVDIEQMRDDMVRREEIARKYFAPGEQEQLNALPASRRARAFFDFWTRKEAFVKARGEGLFSGLDRFETLLAEPRILSINGAPAAEWWMSALPEIDGYAGAVVVNAPSCVPHFWKWTGPLDR
jgi:4'-phosphopantetheinyl transferase